MLERFSSLVVGASPVLEGALSRAAGAFGSIIEAGRAYRVVRPAG
jgi:hypothetical protein